MTEPARTSESEQAGAPAGPGLVTRLLRAGRLFAIFFLAPLIIGNLLGPPGSGWAACTGATVMLGAAMSDGVPAARRAAPVILIGMMLAAATTPGWAWAVLLAVLAAISGLATRWGAGIATSMATLMAVSTPPVAGAGQILLLAAYTAVGGLFGMAMAMRLGARLEPRAAVTSARRSAVIAAGLAVATFTAAAISVLSRWEHSQWIVVAVVVLGIPTPGLTERLMVQRMIGQLLACALVGGLAAVTESVLVMLVAAVVVLMLYLMSMGGSVARQVTYLSAFFMLPIAATTAAPLLVVQRLTFNLLGLGILLVVVAAVRRFGGPQPTAAPATAGS